MENIPSHIRTETRITDSMDKALYALLAEITEATAVCCEEELDPGTYMPVLTADMLKDWLMSTGVDAALHKTVPLCSFQASIASQIIVYEYLLTVLKMDSALETLLTGTASTVSKTALHVNIPYIVEALNKEEMIEGQVYLVMTPEFYDTPPEGDDRVDVLLGVTLWRGAMLCRPVLVSFEKIEHSLKSKLLVMEDKIPSPVNYTPMYGVH